MSELRMILTPVCNYHCDFCHHEGFEINSQYGSENFTKDDWLYLYKTMRNYLGWNTVTLSGGEPLLFNQFDDLVKSLSTENCKVVVTTNGFYINNHTHYFDYVNRVNVSLHTLNEKRYEQITGLESSFQRVSSNIIDLRKKNRELQICLNVTLTCFDASEAEKEVMSIVNFASEIGASVKFTEIFPLTHYYKLNGNSRESIIEHLRKNNFGIVLDNGRKIELCNRKTKCSVNYIFCAYARNQSDPVDICQTNNDFFVSSDGIVKFCRYDRNNTSIYEAVKMRNNKKIVKALHICKKYAKENCKKHLTELEEITS